LEKDELKYLATALADGELESESMRLELESLIKSNDIFRSEYELQRFTKTLVQTKCKFQPSPEILKKKIARKIKPSENLLSKPIELIKDIFTRPAFATAGSLAIILIAVILIFNQSSDTGIFDFASEQSGPENMFIQASANFDNIMCGKLVPQIITDNPNSIKNFFLSKGVKYATLIPQINSWNILGAVVSEGAGEKFAHHVYSNKEGKLVYVYQIDESYVNKCEATKLSKHLMEYLDEGKCFVSKSKDFVTLMKKMDNNICAIVSNTSQDEIENLFCSN
jgi:hypothetical protein